MELRTSINLIPFGEGSQIGCYLLFGIHHFPMNKYTKAIHLFLLRIGIACYSPIFPQCVFPLQLVFQQALP